LQLLNLGAERLEVYLGSLFEDPIGDAGLYEIEFRFVQVEGSERLADGQSQGIESFLFIGRGLWGRRECHGGPQAEYGYQTGDNETHELSFLLCVTAADRYTKFWASIGYAMLRWGSR
jgi:hypothetical protein